MVFVDPQIEVSVIAVLLAIVSQGLQLTLGNKKEMLRHQGEMKKKQAKLKELSKSTHPDAKKQLEVIEKEMMESLNVVMKSSMKLMIASMVIFLPVFIGLSSIYGENIFHLPIPIPWFSVQFDFLNPIGWFSLYNSTSFVGWYFLNALIFSLLIINPLVKLYEKRKEQAVVINANSG